MSDEACTMEVREASPAHFMLKIESFSLLHEHEIHKYETRMFKAGEYTWRLIICLDEGKDYVSVYLAIADTAALPENWVVNVAFSICVLNHISGNYCYTLGRTRRFHAMKTQWGYQKFISNEDFKDPLNGYLIDDNCVFGAEVFINENMAITECLSLKDVCTVPYNRKFKIENFSKLTDIWRSEEFTVGGCKWNVRLHPNGDTRADGRSLSIFLCKVDLKTSSAAFERLYLCYSICIKGLSSQHKPRMRSKTGGNWFTATKKGWGWSNFIELASLNDPNRGFIVNDCCLLEIEISVRAVAS